MRRPREVWVDILTTQEVVAEGLRAILQRVAPFDVKIGPGHGEPDVVLYDLIKLDTEGGADLDYWLAQAASTVIAIDRTLKPELGANARDRGVEWYIDLGITAEGLSRVMREAIGGTLEDSQDAEAWTASAWPGQEMGLSHRESDVLALIVLNHPNQQIAHELHLTLNTVKTFIRSTYRKIGVRDRGAAVTWAIAHGFPTSEPTG
jgi:DNA-binding NarL/FixJ family response regulator